ncbi:MAG TPA: DUF6328 family protein [Xanthomonadaceae bacterium]|nr:DUF6328 family protein [Xanthomonadaceae bacterium]
MTDNPTHNQTEKLPLDKAADFLLNECRMVLPGIQSLFGFQLIAVFTTEFGKKLSVPQQHLHLLAVGLIAIAVAMIMTPAAYHRQTGGREVSETLLRISSRVLLFSMIPLSISLCIEFYIVASVLLDSPLVPALAVALFSVFVGLWFVLPRILVARDR